MDGRKGRTSVALGESALERLCEAGFVFSPATREFKLENAIACAQAASLTYLDSKPYVERVARSWGLHVAVLDERPDWGLVLWNEQLVLIAFRGTNEPRDWVTNLDLLPRPSPFGPVHRGFAKATERLWPQLLPAIENALQYRQALWLTGHSLGGAMAQVCVMRLLTETEWKPAGAYTFAQPRAGGRVFARKLDEHSLPYYRLVNNVDLVPGIPTGLFRTHIGEEIYLDARGQLWPDGVPFGIKARDAFNQGQPEFPSKLLGRDRELLELARIGAHGMERYVLGLLRNAAGRG